jgi:O-antigen/teichoic acid export membrane protein
LYGSSVTTAIDPILPILATAAMVRVIADAGIATAFRAVLQPRALFWSTGAGALTFAIASPLLTPSFRGVGMALTVLMVCLVQTNILALQFLRHIRKPTIAVAAV